MLQCLNELWHALEVVALLQIHVAVIVIWSVPDHITESYLLVVKRKHLGNYKTFCKVFFRPPQKKSIARKKVLRLFLDSNSRSFCRERFTKSDISSFLIRYDECGAPKQKMKCYLVQVFYSRSLRFKIFLKSDNGEYQDLAQIRSLLLQALSLSFSACPFVLPTYVLCDQRWWVNRNRI